MLYFSASSLGFYDDQIHAKVPPGAVAITAARHAQLLADQARGLIITADAHGAPVAVERTIAKAQALADLRERRNRLLAQSDFTQVPDAPLTEAQRELWRIYRQALRNLPETAADPTIIDWPEAPAL